MKIQITKQELLDCLSRIFGQKVTVIEIPELTEQVRKQLEYLEISLGGKKLNENEMREIIKKGIKIS